MAYISGVWPQVHSVAFSPREELLWAGAESGALYALSLPPLRTYSSVRAPALPLADLAPLGDGVVSVSANALRYHASGGLERAALVDIPVSPLAPLPQPHTPPPCT